MPVVTPIPIKNHLEVGLQKSKVCIRCSVALPVAQNPSTDSKPSVVHTFESLADGREHLALSFGDISLMSNPLVRLHSECLTGDVFGSCKCDCGPQLSEAIRILSQEGGILLYLRQEGRGIGLYNKIDAYALQARGMDTFEANQKLNFPDDMRDYRPAAEMLKALGFNRVRLLSNNALKAEQLMAQGIDVSERIPTGTYVNQHNLSYISAKIKKTHHTLKLNVVNESKHD